MCLQTLHGYKTNIYVIRMRWLTAVCPSLADTELAGLHSIVGLRHRIYPFSSVFCHTKYISTLHKMRDCLLCKSHIPTCIVTASLSLTHWGRVVHICMPSVTEAIIGSDNGLSPGRHRVIIWTNAGISLIGPLGIRFSEILIEIHKFSFKKMHLNMLSAKWRLFCPGDEF